MAEGVQDIIIVVVTAAVFAFGWWKTEPIKVLGDTPKLDRLPPEHNDDHQGMI